jgi:hypothetical protein
MGRVSRLAVVLLASALASGLAACTFSYTRVGTEVPDTEDLEIGVSQREDVLERLGAPLYVRRQFDGELYVWRRLQGRSRSVQILPVFLQIFFWEDSRLLRDDVALLFDRDGTLQGIGRRIETDEVEVPEDRTAPSERPIPAEEDAVP